MPIEIRETPSAESVKNNWAQTALTLEPLVDHLKPVDKDHFNGVLSLLIGKEPRMSNIEKKFLFLYIRKARLIVHEYQAKHIFNMEYIRNQIVLYINELATNISEDGLLIKYGVGGYSKQYVEQKVVNENIEPKKKGWFG